MPSATQEDKHFVASSESLYATPPSLPSGAEHRKTKTQRAGAESEVGEVAAKAEAEEVRAAVEEDDETHSQGRHLTSSLGGHRSQLLASAAAVIRTTAAVGSERVVPVASGIPD